MSEAGRSAGVEAHRLVALADAHDERAAAAREAAQRWMIAHRTERQVAGTLAPLSACGFTFLHDRGWPGARRGSRAQIDHVLVGPGGVFVVDTKGWKGVTVAGGRLFRGQADVTDDLAGLADVGVGTEAVLAELGLAPGEVRVVVVLAGSAMDAVALSSLGGLVVVGERRASAFINGFGRRLTERQQHAVLGAVMAHFPPLGEEAVPLDLSVPDPVIEEPALLTVDEVADTFLAGMLAAPIEEWMAFLHPDQAKLVRRSFSGPARIRGAAGTGKTVVGLHRAAYLARGTTGRVIVTTYVRTLPDVLGDAAAAARAGGSRPGRVHGHPPVRPAGAARARPPCRAKLPGGDAGVQLRVGATSAAPAHSVAIDANASYWRTSCSRSSRVAG